MLQNSENNGTEEFGLVAPTPGLHVLSYVRARISLWVTRHFLVRCNAVPVNGPRNSSTGIVCRHIEGLAQDCSISIALAMEILQSCAKPAMYCKLPFIKN